ncbi:Tn3 family transposase [Streptomyces sp. NPDC015032]|uniref:Tn3 family transposase n=1 Tax=Streptomyces sp. NPDC015032 TaxID=3364937 RepID=UPI0036FE02E3
MAPECAEHGGRNDSTRHPHHEPRQADANLRCELNDRLQVVENWNSANHGLLHGKDGDLPGSDKKSHEVSMLAPHLLQSALAHVNTLPLQDILSEERWQNRPTDGPCRRCPEPTSMLGRYSFQLPELPGGLRPLRDPDSAEDE